jgi:hypothetical protein
MRRRRTQLASRPVLPRVADTSSSSVLAAGSTSSFHTYIIRRVVLHELCTCAVSHHTAMCMGIQDYGGSPLLGPSTSRTPLLVSPLLGVTLADCHFFFCSCCFDLGLDLVVSRLRVLA